MVCKTKWVVHIGLHPGSFAMYLLTVFRFISGMLLGVKSGYQLFLAKSTDSSLSAKELSQESCTFNDEQSRDTNLDLNKNLLFWCQYNGIHSNFKVYYPGIKRRYYWLNKSSQTNSCTWKGYMDLLRNFVFSKLWIVYTNV